jgi:mevalonate pyrophosphate decarboxylase
MKGGHRKREDNIAMYSSLSMTGIPLQHSEKTEVTENNTFHTNRLLERQEKDDDDANRKPLFPSSYS